MKNVNTLFLGIVFMTLSFIGYKEYIKSVRIKKHEQAMLDDLKYFYSLAKHPSSTKNYYGVSHIDEIAEINEKFYTDTLTTKLSHYDNFTIFFNRFAPTTEQFLNDNHSIETAFNIAKLSGDLPHLPINKLRLISHAYADIEKLRKSFIQVKELEPESLKILQKNDDSNQFLHFTRKISDALYLYNRTLTDAIISAEYAIEAIEGNDDWIKKTEAAYKIPIIYYYGKLPSDEYFISDSLAIQYGFKIKYIDSIPEDMKENWKVYNNDADKTLQLKWADNNGNWKEFFEKNTGKDIDIYFDNKP